MQTAPSAQSINFRVDPFTESVVQRVLGKADAANDARLTRLRTVAVGVLWLVQGAVAALTGGAAVKGLLVLGAAFIYAVALELLARRYRESSLLHELSSLLDLVVMHTAYRQLWQMLPGLRPYDEMLQRMPVTLSALIILLNGMRYKRRAWLVATIGAVAMYVGAQALWGVPSPSLALDCAMMVITGLITWRLTKATSRTLRESAEALRMHLCDGSAHTCMYTGMQR